MTAYGAHLSLDMRLVVQNDIQQGTVDSDAAVVVNEAQLSKFVHEKTHAVTLPQGLNPA
jgi:hypothetical protein